MLCEECEKEAEHRHKTLQTLTKQLASSAEKIDKLTEKIQKRVEREADREQYIEKRNDASYANMLNITMDTNKETNYESRTYSAVNKGVDKTTPKEDASKSSKKFLDNIVVIYNITDNLSTKNSSTICREISKEFKDTAIKFSRTTPQGTVTIECYNSKDAEDIIKKWSGRLFGGNSKVRGVIKHNTTAIIKEIDKTIHKDDIRKNILDQYPGTLVDVFQNRNRENGSKNMGIVKLTFQDEETLDKARRENIRIGREIHHLEEYIRKPKVIICNKCQKYGHIERLCKQKSSRCGRCSETNTHTTRQCNTNRIKCPNCAGPHKVGDRDCQVFQKRIQEIKEKMNHMNHGRQY